MSERTPFTKVLVANRGEIAMRIFRSARQAGYRTLAVFSQADEGAPHVAAADEAVAIGGAAAADSYLRIDRLIEAARLSGADAIHPGYGFLAENAAFAEACAEAGLVFVGPSAASIRAMGDKARAKALMIEAGVPCVPGYQGDDQTGETLAAEAAAIGFPVMIKAVAGGGGRGMRLVREAADFDAALRSARSEAQAAFADGTVLIEKAIVDPRHIEIQILVDRHGNAIHLGERDCSVQRRHQKLIEEAPSPAVSEGLRTRMGEAAIRAVQAIGYEGAGTLEFLLSPDGSFYFMEMNTRLQVEHPVTEAITGLDLVSLQLDIAAGHDLPLRQEDVRFSGHAIEVRLCAEDPEQDFLPQSGRLSAWTPPAGLRVEHALTSGSLVSPHYDSMVAKLVAHGRDREEARRRLIDGLERTVAFGLRTNQSFLADCLDHPVFVAGEATTGFVGHHGAGFAERREDGEGFAAKLAAAIMRAWPPTRLAHGFPVPLRLSRDTRIHEVLVETGPAGRAVASAADGIVAIDVVAHSDGLFDIEFEGRREHVRLARDGGFVWLVARGRTYDFRDMTLEPVATAEGAGEAQVRASMNGRLTSLDVAVGDPVKRGQRVAVVEAMKMEHAHVAAIDGTVGAVHAGVGDQVETHRVLIELVPA